MAQRIFLEPLLPDLAPGDYRSLDLSLEPFRFTLVDSPSDPVFDEAYRFLSSEFGPLHELEERPVLERRLLWDSRHSREGRHFLYHMVAVHHAGRLVAVRDHTAIVAPSAPYPRSVVHLSHVLIAPDFRRTGLAGWLRVLPIQTARACLASAGLSTHWPIVLTAEMEHPDLARPERSARLKAYEKAGFLKLDPALLDYRQPDFRPPEAIDATGGPRPLPFALLVRHKPALMRPEMSADDARALMRDLYAMYEQEFRKEDMAGVYLHLNQWSPPANMIALVPPTQ